MSQPIIHRRATAQVARLFNAHPAVTVVGPRQCGKTTLARMFTEKDPQVNIFDLERFSDRRRLENPESTLLNLTGTVVIDEVQRIPELFEILRVVIDSPHCKSRYLLLGSVSPTLIKGVAESLAGRVGIVNLGGFTMDEIPKINWQTLWYRGGFPRSLLADDDESSVDWRENFIATFLERDIPQYGITIPSETLRRFWIMLAHYHGQIWNAAEFARAIGRNESTARNYLDILSSTYVIRILSPWYENLRKRQIKSPKIYVRDTGLLHSLLEINSFGTLSSHPKIGASFEGFAVENIVSQLKSKNCFFWGTHAGAELDLMTTIAGKRYGFEIKYSESVGSTRSMRTAIADLQLEHLWVVYPGSECFKLDQSISVVSIERVTELIDRLKLGERE